MSARRVSRDGACSRVSSSCLLHPPPSALHPTPVTLHPTPYTLHPTPYTLHPLGLIFITATSAKRVSRDGACSRASSSRLALTAWPSSLSMTTPAPRKPGRELWGWGRGQADQLSTFDCFAFFALNNTPNSMKFGIITQSSEGIVEQDDGSKHPSKQAKEDVFVLDEVPWNLNLKSLGGS